MRRILLHFISGCLLSFVLVSCAVNPVTGKREFMLISEQQEISLGQETDQQIRSQYGVYDHPGLNEYVTRVGMTMVPHSHRSHLGYHFAVLDTPVVNAFAVPGGYIYVTRGILAMMNSEAELAVVLGHELGHVNARHSARRLSNMILVQVGLAVGGALSETFAKISGAASVGIQLLFLKYSRGDERQADRLGVEYARKGSYNPGKMIDFFSSLQKMGDLSGGHALPGFLSTHPLTGERIKNTQAMITETDRGLHVRQNDYFNRINNMVYGKDPRQGFIEGNTFYHPQMKFFFSFPREWKVQNTPTQVTLVPENQKAAVILQAEKNSANLKEFAQTKSSSLEGRQLIRENHLTINGLSSFQQYYDLVREDQQDLRVRMSFIKYGAYIFTFTALSSRDDFDEYTSQFGSLIGSFNTLKERKYLNRRPQRLKLIKATGRQTLQVILQRAGMDKDLCPRFAIINNMQLDQTPKPGQLIKILQ